MDDILDKTPVSGDTPAESGQPSGETRVMAPLEPFEFRPAHRRRRTEQNQEHYEGETAEPVAAEPETAAQQEAAPAEPQAEAPAETMQVPVSVPEAAHIDYKWLNEQVGLKRLGMASGERLEKYLGVEQGSVSPLGVLNDAEHEVLVVMDKKLSDDTEVVVHPNDNTMSVWMKYKDLKKLVTGLGNRLVLLEFEEEVVG